MKPATSLTQLESRVKSLAANFTKKKAENLDASTHGWSFCAVGLKLKEVGIDIDLAKRNGCLGSSLVTRVCGEELKQRGGRFNTDLYSPRGLRDCLDLIKDLQTMSSCQLLK